MPYNLFQRKKEGKERKSFGLSRQNFFTIGVPLILTDRCDKKIMNKLNKLIN